MIKKITLNAFSDPSHGWIKVPMALLNQLQIAQKISHYSYKRGEFAYLEEDRDASILMEAMSEQGIKYRIKDNISNKSSNIRSYIPFTQGNLWRQF